MPNMSFKKLKTKAASLVATAVCRLIVLLQLGDVATLLITNHSMPL